jgi:hypothetical protein
LNTLNVNVYFTFSRHKDILNITGNIFALVYFPSQMFSITMHKTIDNFIITFIYQLYIVIVNISERYNTHYKMYLLTPRKFYMLVTLRSAFFFFAVYVQRRLIFSCRLLFIVCLCFGLTGHHQMYRSVVMNESAAHCNAVHNHKANTCKATVG